MIKLLKTLTLLVAVSMPSLLNAREIFVGCAPSAGECRNSCRDHIGRAEANSLQCPFEFETWGCFCGTPSSKPPQTVPEGFTFIGCRPSLGECFNSCPSRTGISQDSPEMCHSNYDLEPFACFCEQ